MRGPSPSTQKRVGRIGKDLPIIPVGEEEVTYQAAAIYLSWKRPVVGHSSRNGFIMAAVQSRENPKKVGLRGLGLETNPRQRRENRLREASHCLLVGDEALLLWSPAGRVVQHLACRCTL